MNEIVRQSRFRIAGMDCAGCASKIDIALRRLPGVEDVSVSVAAGTLAVRHAPDSDLGALQRRVVGLGYGIAPITVPVAADTQEPGPACCDPAHDHAHDRDHPHDHAYDHAHVHAPARSRADEPAPAGLHGHDHGPSTGPWWRAPKGVLTIASGAALLAAFGLGAWMPALAPAAFGAAMLVGLVPIARRAVMAARAGAPFTIEMLMTIAAVGAVLIGAVEEGATVVVLFLVGEMLEGVAAGRARASIGALTALVPRHARVERDGALVEMAADAVRIGDVVLVRPGERLPADGTILAGESAIDEAPVTGESLPVHKGEGAAVFAGTVNGAAVLRVTVTAAASDNTIARVVRLVEAAQESKAPTERVIDRFARVYTPAVLATGALVACVPPLLFGGLWSAWIYKGLAILLIGCPCALVISTPAAIAASLAAGARRGLLLKGGAVLERLRDVTAICFDKTGTLTLGRPVVTDLVPAEIDAPELLRLAAALETGSSHPLAAAIRARAAADGSVLPAVSDARAAGGAGIEGTCEGQDLFLGSPAAAAARRALPPDLDARIAALQAEGKTVSVLLAGNRVAGAIALRDEIRPDAAAGLAALSARGIETVMLTGDHARAAEAVGRQLGIAVRADLLPADKQRIVREMQARGRVVAKVGDGINDAPALAAADIGIAMAGATDVALETADAAVLHGRVADIAALIALSRRTMANIRQNIALALGLKAVFLVTTLIGVTGLWPAILADTGATVLVTLNALRLLGRGRD